MSVGISNIDPITLELQSYSSQDSSLISPQFLPSQFNPLTDYVEYTILSDDGSFQVTEQEFTDYKIVNNPAPAGSDLSYSVDLDPEKDLVSRGFSNGRYNTIYKFLRNELNSSPIERIFYIKEISSDRTELKLGINNFTNTSLEVLVNDFKNSLTLDSVYFQDFYLNFGNNSLIIANNILVDTTKPQYELLINLYEPLPSRFKLKENLWVVTQVANPLAFNLQFFPEVSTPVFTTPSLKGPNFDLPIKNRTNNSTNYINYEQLLTTGLVSSYDQILSYLEDKSISVGIDYTEFENFVHFSSAESRVKNFFYKVQLIEQYSASLEAINPSAIIPSSSTIILQEKITNIIQNFDGFEYYLYFSSGSNTYPKKSTPPPYTLISSGDDIVQIWYTSSVMSASLYDANNKDYLYYTIPTYLTDDPQNDPYKVFIDMIGQHYDNIWIYYKDVTNRYNGDNRLEFGISKDLVADAIRSFGLKIYQNNFSVSDLFDAFAGFNSGSYSRSATPDPLPNGGIGFDGEQILTYQTASQQSLYTPLDDVNKEMYKRIYHNLPYLLKSKGTVAGLQNIISMFGITSSILSVKEFGGEWNNARPITGIQDIVTDNIQILTSAQMSASFPPLIPPNTTDATYALIPQFVLSSQKSILENYDTNRSLSPNVNTVEITFSPQNDIDNFIKQPGNLSNFDIGTYIGDPSQTFLPYYPDLQAVAANLLVNNDLSPITYIRLIKYFDNSLFNMIKDFVPARTNLKSGITIKPHLLNRSKLVQPQMYMSSSIHTGSIDTAFIEGGTGGSFDDYNSLTPSLNNTQSWSETIITPSGPTQSLHTDQAEFYNGELPYYPTVATDGELNPDNPFKYPSDNPLNNPTYSVVYYYSNNISLAEFIDPEGGNNPSTGQIFVWVDITQILTLTTYVIRYIKINITSVNGIDNTNILYDLQNLTLPYITTGPSGDTWNLNTVVGLGSFINTNNYFGYQTIRLVPTSVNSIPINNYPINFFPGVVSDESIYWDYYDYNPLINNSFTDATSTHYMKVDYTVGINSPSNFPSLITSSADKAAVQDSNYSSKTWSNLRYNGSRQSSLKFNISF
jgi:hypothetical protein